MSSLQNPRPLKFHPSMKFSQKFKSLFQNPLDLLAWSILILLAFWLRLPHFCPLALNLDEVQYAYCAETKQFPHSPYLLFLWMGYLLHLFVSLDWGYSALSMASSLFTLYFLGAVAAKITGSKFAGWMTALAFAISPIAIRVAGKQEVYAFQLVLLSLAWYLWICRRSSLGAGLALGATIATHQGTLFALPGTLILFLEPWIDSDSRQASEEVSTQRIQWKSFVLGTAVPVIMVLTWFFGVWVNQHGTGEMAAAVEYLKGASPSPDFKTIIPQEETEGLLDWMGQLRENVGDQLERFWDELANPHVIPRGAVLFGFLGLLLIPWRVALPWWLMALPYLAYEFAAGWTLDPGIYSVYILPTVVVAVGFMAEKVVLPRIPFWRRCVSAICFVGVVISLGIVIPSLQAKVHRRSLEPWWVEHGAAMSLTEWVGENTPEDTVVVVPTDWFYCRLAIPYYGDRIPFSQDGYITLPRKWEKLRVDWMNESILDQWFDSNRPFLSYDHNPFTGFGASWAGMNIDRFEVRPILWLDRNHTGTSRFWKNPEIMVEIEPWLIDDKERRPHFYIEEYFPTEEIEADLYHPTLYRICRKTDPMDSPEWVKDLEEKVPSEQLGSPSTWKGKGILFTGEASFYSPCVQGEDHAVRARIHTKGQEYGIRCEVRYDGEWVLVGEDVEKYVNDPPEVFTDLYFHIPAKYVDDDNLRVRISPSTGTDFVNLFHIAVAKVDPLD